MTQRLTDDEIRALREDVSGLLLTVAMRKAMLRLLDEIEERRRIDARRLADAEQAFREECEAEEQKRKDFIAQRNDPSLDDYEKRASKFWGVDLRGRMKRVDGYLPSVPAGKDGGA